MLFAVHLLVAALGWSAGHVEAFVLRRGSSSSPPRAAAPRIRGLHLVQPNTTTHVFRRRRNGGKASAQETQKQLELVLARVGQLESRVVQLEAERARLLNNPLRKLGSHLSTTAGRLVGAKPLPGINRGIVPVDALVKNMSDSRSLRFAKATNYVMGRSATAVGRSASAAADLAVGKARNLSMPFYRAGVAATDVIAEYVPATSLPAATDGLGGIPIPSTVLALASRQQQLYDSRRVLISCVTLGGALGLLAGRLTRSSLVFSAISTAFFAAYASTLSNPAGKFVRLCGIIVLAILGAVVGFVKEQWRQFTYVYQTGKAFEKIDAQLQGWRVKLGGTSSGASGKSPSKVVDETAAFLKAEFARTGAGANRTLVEGLQPWLSNASTAVGEWSGSSCRASTGRCASPRASARSAAPSATCSRSGSTSTT